MGTEEADPPVFSVDVRAGAACTEVSVTGELDLATVDEFSSAILGGLATGAVFLDLRQVTFMDSAGVRALNTALRESAERGRSFRVSGELQAGVVQVLEMTGMLDLLPVEEEP